MNDSMNSMNIVEAMRGRRSVRSYDGAGLTDAQCQALLRAVDESWSPFGGDVTVRLKAFRLKDGYKPSTYGMIRGAVEFFLLAMGPDRQSALSAGFRFEQVVLRAWQMGLGTCWIAGTFRGSDFERGQTWPQGQRLTAVCPVGVAAKPSLMERFTRVAVGSTNRRPFDDLFFNGDFSHPVTGDCTFVEALKMLRLAPSSSNSQPWRVLVQGDSTAHFYCKGKGMLPVLDCGIGLCHFAETERFMGHDGRFFTADHAPAPPHGWRYLTSYSR